MVGVTPRNELNNDVFCFLRVGSEDGVRVPLFFVTLRGVMGVAGDFVLPLIFLASLRRGDIDLESVLAELGALEFFPPLGGVTR